MGRSLWSLQDWFNSKLSESNYTEKDIKERLHVDLFLLNQLRVRLVIALFHLSAILIMNSIISNESNYLP